MINDTLEICIEVLRGCPNTQVIWFQGDPTFQKTQNTRLHIFQAPNWDAVCNFISDTRPHNKESPRVKSVEGLIHAI